MALSMASNHHQEKLLGTREEDLKDLLAQKNVKEEELSSLIRTIDGWMQKVPHLAHLKNDERYIRRVLISVGFSIEKAKEKVEHYYTSRSKWPEIFATRDPNRAGFMQAMDVVDVSVTPKKSPQNFRICVLKLSNANIDLFSLPDIIQILCMISDIRSHLDTHSGEVYIWDCRDASISHILKLLPYIKDLVSVIQDSYCFKIKEMHLLNAPSIVYKAIDVFRSVVKEKIGKRIYFHKDLKSLHEAVPRECLPMELGGHQPTCREITEMWRDAILSPEWKSWFLQSEKNKSDESKRPKGSSNSREDFGVQGSFKNICID